MKIKLREGEEKLRLRYKQEFCAHVFIVKHNLVVMILCKQMRYEQAE